MGSVQPFYALMMIIIPQFGVWIAPTCLFSAEEQLSPRVDKLEDKLEEIRRYFTEQMEEMHTKEARLQEELCKLKVENDTFRAQLSPRKRSDELTAAGLDGGTKEFYNKVRMKVYATLLSYILDSAGKTGLKASKTEEIADSAQAMADNASTIFGLATRAVTFTVRRKKQGVRKLRSVSVLETFESLPDLDSMEIAHTTALELAKRNSIWLIIGGKDAPASLAEKKGADVYHLFSNGKIKGFLQENASASSRQIAEFIVTTVEEETIMTLQKARRRSLPNLASVFAPPPPELLKRSSCIGRIQNLATQNLNSSKFED